LGLGLGLGLERHGAFVLVLTFKSWSGVGLQTLSLESNPGPTDQPARAAAYTRQFE